MIALIIKAVTRGVIKSTEAFVASKVAVASTELGAIATGAVTTANAANTTAAGASGVASGAADLASSVNSALTSYKASNDTAVTAAQSKADEAYSLAQTAQANILVNATYKARLDEALDTVDGIVAAIDDQQLDTIKEIADRIKADAADVVSLRTEVTGKLNALLLTDNGQDISTMNETDLTNYIESLVSAEVAAITAA